MIQDPFGIFLALAAAVFLAVWLEGRYRFFRAMSAGLMCLVFGMILSNSGLLPGGRPGLLPARQHLGERRHRAGAPQRGPAQPAGRRKAHAGGVRHRRRRHHARDGDRHVPARRRHRSRDLEAHRAVHRDLHRRRGELLRARERLRDRSEHHVGSGGRRRHRDGLLARHLPDHPGAPLRREGARPGPEGRCSGDARAAAQGKRREPPDDGLLRALRDHAGGDGGGPAAGGGGTRDSRRCCG